MKSLWDMIGAPIVAILPVLAVTIAIHTLVMITILMVVVALWPLTPKLRKRRK